MINEILLGLPLYIAVALSVIIIFLDAFSGKNKSLIYFFTIISFLLLIGASVYSYSITSSVSFNIENSLTKGMLLFGKFPLIFDIIFAVAGLLTVLSGVPYLRREFDDYKEFYTLVLYSVTGMMIIAHSNHLIMIFVGIELMSIAFYVLTGFIRNRITSVEAALKYFLLGAFASGFLLYGIALSYGASSTMYLNQISNNILSGNIDLFYLQVGFALIIIGLSFKIAAFPFHQWAPDVYHGAPTIVTGFMSTAGKAAAISAFVLIGINFLPQLKGIEFNEKLSDINNYIEKSKFIIAILSSLTMLLGNILALIQKNIKRMLAYSSIAHAGYLLIGIVANNNDGFTGIIFYAAAYTFMQVGAFVIVSNLEVKDSKLDLSDYNGLKKSHPWLALLMAIFMFSLAGIPPFAGFPGKYILFVSAIESGFTWLTIIAVISTIISMYFYIGLIINMYFKEPEGELITANVGSSYIALIISVFFVLFLGVFPNVLIDIAKTLF